MEERNLNDSAAVQGYGHLPQLVFLENVDAFLFLFFFNICCFVFLEKHTLAAHRTHLFTYSFAFVEAWLAQLSEAVYLRGNFFSDD